MSRWRYTADLRSLRAFRRLRGERPFRLAGQCARSGRCCEAPAVAVNVLVWWLPLFRLVYLWWQKRVNGFEFARADAEAQVFVFRCTHYDRQSRSCDSYDSRPAICRDYPRYLLWQPNPELLPGCGYRAVAPNAVGLRSAIDSLDLTPGQREKLRRGLKLDE